jgi:TonB family protein
MRLNTILSLSTVLIAALCAPASLHAQQPGLQNGPKPTVPDLTAVPPEKLLAAAQAHNGAGEVPGDGWHIKATFDVLTNPGSRSSGMPPIYTSGSYEETWYAPQNYRRTFTYKGITHTDIATPDGLFRSGDQGWDTPAEANVRNLLVTPIPLDPPSPQITLRTQSVTAGKATFPCLFQIYKLPPGLSKKDEQDMVDHSPRICFDPGHPIVRFTAGIGSEDEVFFSKIAVLKGRAIAQEISVQDGEAASLRVHVQEVSTPPDPTGPMVPPADAKKLVSPVTVAWETMSVQRMPEPHKPVYPVGAIQEHLEGEVNIALVISPEGIVTSAKIVDGIQMLRDSALDFVKSSKFKPFLLSGTPVEVHTTAHIVFSAGGGVSASDARKH